MPRQNNNRRNNRRSRHNNNNDTTPLQYPKFTRDDRFQLAQDQCARAHDKAIEFFNQVATGWGIHVPNDVLSDAQKALSAINREMAPALMLRDQLEVAVMNLTRVKEEVDTRTGGWGNVPAN